MGKTTARITKLAGAVAAVAATLVGVNAAPAGACTLAVTTITASARSVPAGGTVHLTTLGAPLYEYVPADEVPSTTSTTTDEGGGATSQCPATRPASSFDVSLSRTNPQDQITSEVILHVEGSTLDRDVMIPASTEPGEVTLSATHAEGVKIVVTRGGRLPATGSALWAYTGLAMLALSIGFWLLGVRRLLPSRTR
jgi:hypothetical protein